MQIKNKPFLGDGKFWYLYLLDAVGIAVGSTVDVLIKFEYGIHSKCVDRNLVA